MPTKSLLTAVLAAVRVTWVAGFALAEGTEARDGAGTRVLLCSHGRTGPAAVAVRSRQRPVDTERAHARRYVEAKLAFAGRDDVHRTSMLGGWGGGGGGGGCCWVSGGVLFGLAGAVPATVAVAGAHGLRATLLAHALYHCLWKPSLRRQRQRQRQRAPCRR